MAAQLQSVRTIYRHQTGSGEQMQGSLAAIRCGYASATNPRFA